MYLNACSRTDLRCHPGSDQNGDPPGADLISTRTAFSPAPDKSYVPDIAYLQNLFIFLSVCLLYFLRCRDVVLEISADMLPGPQSFEE